MDALRIVAESLAAAPVAPPCPSGTPRRTERALGLAFPGVLA